MIQQPLRPLVLRGKRRNNGFVLLLACVLVPSLVVIARWMFSASAKTYTNRTVSQSSDSYFSESERFFASKTEFRHTVIRAHRERGGVVDEVVYSLQSRPDSAKCNAKLVQEVIASALSMRKHCVRCDFEIVLVADDPIFTFVTSAEHNVSGTVFDRTLQSPVLPISTVFAARKPMDLMQHAQRPFVIFVDADMYSNHRAVPESIFDMLHKEYDLIMPMDWAHRHGELWGRGVPGLCTCLIGFINTPSVLRIFSDWQQAIHDIGHDDAKRKRWEDLMKTDLVYQHRDQEMLSIVLHENAYPDVKLLPLAIEWACPDTNHASSLWAEGVRKHSQDGPFKPLTHNPCKVLHSHTIPIDAYSGAPPDVRKWITTLEGVGAGTSDDRRCGGALKTDDL